MLYVGTSMVIQVRIGLPLLCTLRRRQVTFYCSDNSPKVGTIDDMDALRFVLLCVVATAIINAKVHKSQTLEYTDLCRNYKEIAKSEQSNKTYMSCGFGVNDTEMCYLATLKCDSVMDCDNFRDEEDCESQHRDNCVNGTKVSRDGAFINTTRCASHDSAKPDDIICILEMQLCDGYSNCPNGDDEENCDGTQH